MKNTNYKRILIAVLIAVTFSACASKGKPTPEGVLLNQDQIKALAKDQSMNGKIVEIEGYPAFCSMIVNVRPGAKSKMEIHADADCKGDVLIEANLLFGGNTTRLSGEKERNYVAAGKTFDNASLRFVTDDYQELPNGKFKFSGTLIYTGDSYYLDNITIHK